MTALLLLDGSIHQGSIWAIPVRKLMVQILFVGLIQHKEGCREGGNAAYTQGLAPKKSEAILRSRTIHNVALQ